MGWTFTNERKIYKEFQRIRKKKIKYSEWKKNVIENLYDERLTIEELEDLKKPYELNNITNKSGGHIVDFITKITPILLMLVTIISAISSQILSAAQVNQKSQLDTNSLVTVNENPLSKLGAVIANMNLEFINMQMNVMVLIGICLLVFYIVGLVYDKFRAAKKGIRFYYNKEIVELLEDQINKLKKA